MCLNHEPLSYRIATRYLLSSSLGDPKKHLAEFRKAFQECAQYEDDIQKALAWLHEAGKKQDPNYMNKPLLEAPIKDMPSRLYASFREVYQKLTTSWFYWRLRTHGAPLFYSILKTYQLSPKTRKAVEKASRFYARRTMRFKEYFAFLVDNIKTAETYLKLISEARAHLKVAELAIKEGDAHKSDGSSTVWKAGPFTLINTGGFSDSVMENVQSTVEKAVELMKRAGLSKVLYGDIQVTNTIAKGNWAAFYHVPSDEVFIRANVKPTVDMVRMVCHELAHRLHHKFLKSKDREIRRLYEEIQDESAWYKLDKSLLPKPGDVLTLKSRQLMVERFDPLGKKVYLTDANDVLAGSKWVLPLKAWLDSHIDKIRDTPGYKGFVTPYARKSPDENFAEMVAFYVTGKLPKAQVPMLEEILF